MIKKFFLLCLAMIFVVQGAASAKEKGLPEEERVRVAVEVVDGSRHVEFGTAQNLGACLNEKLVEKNFVSVVNVNPSADTPAENFSAETVGEILVFNAVELPTNSAVPEDFDQSFYQGLGADYVVRCEVLALGVSKVEDNTIGWVATAIGAGLTLAGNGNKHNDKTLRTVGNGISCLSYINMLDVTKRTALDTVVNMQFISVATGEVVWQENFTGQAVRHHHPRKDYDDAWTQAYVESVADAAKKISKRVNKYVDKVIVKGKSDKSFLPKKSVGKLIGGKLF